jgi:hypothetical protein
MNLDDALHKPEALAALDRAEEYVLMTIERDDEGQFLTTIWHSRYPIVPYALEVIREGFDREKKRGWDGSAEDGACR